MITGLHSSGNIYCSISPRSLRNNTRGFIAVVCAVNALFVDGTLAAIGTANRPTTFEVVRALLASTFATLAAAADRASLVLEAVAAQAICSRRER